MNGLLVKSLVRELAAPLARRAGSLLAGYLIANGIAAETASTLETGLIAAVAVAVDLFLSHKNRQG